MFPGFFEWIWDGGHMVFMGGLWYALSIMGAGLTFCLIKSAMDTMNDDAHGHDDHH